MQNIKLKFNIPKGWQKTSFGNVAKLRKGLTYKTSDYSNEQDGLVFLTFKSILRGGGFNNDGIKYYLGKYDKTTVVKAGDLIIANTDITRDAEVVGAPVFIPFLSDKPILISMDLSAIDVDDKKINKLFLYYLLRDKSARDFMRSQSSGSTVLHLKTSNVSKFEILLPSIFEQKKIAEILSTVDDEIKKIDEIISKTEKLKTGLMKNLFIKGIGHKKFKKTKIGNIPESWNVITIKDAPIELIDGDRGVNYPKLSDFSLDGHCLFLNNKNIKDDQFIFSDIQFISQKKDELLRKGKLKRLDVVLTTRGTVGNVAFYNNDVIFENIRINSGMILLRAYKELSPAFLYHLMKSPFMKKRYRDVVSGSAQPQLPIRSLQQIYIPIPPEDEQEKMVEISQSIDKKISINTRYKKTLMKLKKGLMQDLLSGKVRTKI